MHVKFKQLCAAYDCVDRLGRRDQIKLYVEMMKYEDLKCFVEQPLRELKQQLLAEKNVSLLRYVQALLYEIGIDFQFHLTQTLYSNPQNVHTLAKSTELAALKIIKAYSTETYFRPRELIEFKEFFDTIELVSYYAFDPKVLFMAVWNCIDRNENRQELLERLCQELRDSIGLCLTGYISRLVNCLRGFNLSEFETVVDDYEYERAKTFHQFTKNICDCTDIAKEVQELVNSLRVNLSTRYGLRILKEYTGVQWYVENGKYYF